MSSTKPAENGGLTRLCACDCWTEVTKPTRMRGPRININQFERSAKQRC